VWTTGYYEVVVNLDERGVLERTAPIRLNLIAGQPITLVASFWKLDPLAVPPAFISISLGNPLALRWIAKRNVDDDDSAALWNVAGTFQTIAPYAVDQVGRVDVPASMTQEAVDQAYSEIVVYHGTTLEPRLRIPLGLTLTKRGRTFADDL
jgi:hypothetical protein